VTTKQEINRVKKCYNKQLEFNFIYSKK